MSVDSDDSVWWEAHYAYDGKMFLAAEVFHRVHAVHAAGERIWKGSVSEGRLVAG